MAINSARDVSISSLANASRGINRVAADIAHTGIAAQSASAAPESGAEPRPVGPSYVQSAVELKIYSAQAVASVKMIETIDEMLGALIDEQV